MTHKIYYNYNNIIRYVNAQSKFAIRFLLKLWILWNSSLQYPH